ncbi:MAG: fumarate reductase/succinate dehydrogenase flavoprotein subunit [Spirochaetia bacterium]|nr:fumarate reductase/succinate dehydrogenase flavoprotein subunit [Spirochaetia bacterium]
MNKLNPNTPDGNLANKWKDQLFNFKLVNPANKRKFDIIVIGCGLAGSSAAASLAELGYNIKIFTYHDSPRRAHSIAAQGGINAAKNYQNDGDNVHRLFYDTIKGGDFRSREANVHRLAEISEKIIDQCVAQGVPFARDYGGHLDNRSFGGAQVSRTFYAKGQTGQQLLLGAYGALNRQIHKKKVTVYNYHEMLDLVVIDGKAVGVVTRDLRTGEISSHAAHAIVLASGGYSNIFYLSTNAKASNATAIWRAHKKGAFFANPCFTQIHPTCIPASGHYQSKLTLMSESLRNDGRVWVPKKKNDGRYPEQIPQNERDYFLERKYPSFGNLVPRDVAARNIKEVCDEGFGVGSTGLAVYLDFEDAIKRLGEEEIESKYGNLFEMYELITGDDPFVTPMKIYPAAHYTMGGLWVDYNLMSTIPGLFVLGEANFSDHGANRLGASALMQGLADGYFVIPYTLGNYLATANVGKPDVQSPEFKEAEKSISTETGKMLASNGTTTPDEIHRKLGEIMRDYVGMARNAAGLKIANAEIQKLKQEFKNNLKISMQSENLNDSLEKAGRVKDFLELAELMAEDALQRNESCGGHFRTEYQTPEGEALRNDRKFAHVSAWEYIGKNKQHKLHIEKLKFEYIKLSSRSYK